MPYTTDSIKSSDPRTISVDGTAGVEIVPDRCELVLGVETRALPLSAATQENDARVRRVIAFLREIGIPADRIQTDYVSIQPVYEQDDSPKLGHYEVQKSIVALLSDLGRFDEVLAGAVDRGITHVLDVTFRTSDLRAHRDRARETAAATAREKAGLLAQALGAEVGEVLKVTENIWGGGFVSRNYEGFRRRRERGYFDSKASLGDEAGEEGGASAPGRIRIGAQVVVTFALQ